jgi:hypothetical protein
MHGVGSRNKLTPAHAHHYPSDSMLDVLGRALCTVGRLPRKELHEAWEIATRVRDHFRDAFAGLHLSRIGMPARPQSGNARSSCARYPQPVFRLHLWLVRG